MPNDFMLGMGLHAAGFDDQQIAQIEAAIPDLLHIVATFNAIRPRINRVAPVIQMVLEKLNP